MSSTRIIIHIKKCRNDYETYDVSLSVDSGKVHDRSHTWLECLKSIGKTGEKLTEVAKRTVNSLRNELGTSSFSMYGKGETLIEHFAGNDAIRKFLLLEE